MTTGMPTLAQRYSARSNAFGLIRLVLTLVVVVDHSGVIGFAGPALGVGLTRHQIDFGELALAGFFLLSGFLVLDSALSTSWRRFAWRRLLRVFPGFWVCLLVTAGVFGPLAAYLESGSLAGYWTHPDGPLRYLTTNVFTSMDQYTISGLLAHTPFGELTGGPSGFDGSLWTLHYELMFYLLVAALSACAVLHRARRAVALIAGCFYALVVRELIASPGWAYHPPHYPLVRPLPLIGAFSLEYVIHLGLMFLIGASIYLYRDRIPMHGTLAAAAGTLMVLSMVTGGFYVVGLPAFAYLLIYLGVALPDRLRRVNRRHDYTYGLYIYAFPIQQLLALAGGNRFGQVAYLALTLACTLPLAALSWHLIERPALGLKNVQFGAQLRWMRDIAPDGPPAKNPIRHFR